METGTSLVGSQAWHARGVDRCPPSPCGDEASAQQDGRGRRRSSGGDRAHRVLPCGGGEERRRAGGSDCPQVARQHFWCASAVMGRTPCGAFWRRSAIVFPRVSASSPAASGRSWRRTSGAGGGDRAPAPCPRRRDGVARRAGPSRGRHGARQGRPRVPAFDDGAGGGPVTALRVDHRRSLAPSRAPWGPMWV